MLSICSPKGRKHFQFKALCSSKMWFFAGRLFFLISNAEVCISLNQCSKIVGTFLEVLPHDRLSEKVSILLTQMDGEMQAPLREHLWYFISSPVEEDTSKIDHALPTQREVIPVQLKGELTQFT